MGYQGISLSRWVRLWLWMLVVAMGIVAGAANGQPVTYFHNDLSGSPLLATNEAGEVVWTETYRPYGDQQLSEVNSSDNALWFAGKPYDEWTALSHMGARDYAPTAGRFMSMDPGPLDLGNIQSFNRYAYGNNNPYRYVDPDGHSPLDVGFLIYDVVKLAAVVGTGGGGGAIGAAAADVALSLVGVLSPAPGVGQALKAAKAADRLHDAQVAVARGEDISVAATETVTVQRWMSKAELKATQETGLLRGGRDGTHYVTDAANADPLRARQRLALDRTPEVRATLEVPGSALSASSRVNPKYNMPGGGMERTATGNVPARIIGVD